MDAATRRRSIALKSPLNPPDLRPRCETCLRLLSRADFVSYWDGCPDLERENAVPRLCVGCCDEAEVKQS